MSAVTAPKDGDRNTAILATSSTDGVTPVLPYADPTTNRLLVDLPSGAGTVTSVSVASANGFAGTVANPTTTPAITMETSVTGVLKGNGTAISAATAGTDYSDGTSALATGILKSTTTTGALTIATASDFPTLNQDTTGTAAGLSATLAPASGGTGVANNDLSTITVSGAYPLTLTLGASTSLALPSSGTVTAQGNTVTGTGDLVLATSPTLVTPTLGVATATSVNKVALTAPATGSTLTIADGKTLTVDNSLELAGTDSTKMTFPSSTDTVVGEAATQTLTNKTLTSPVISTILNTGTITLPTSTDTLVGRATTDTLTNKTLTTPTLTKPTIDGSVGALTTDTDGATITFDLSASNNHQVTLGGNRTLAISNGSTGQIFTIDLIQDATGSRTVTWFSTIKWPSGTVPTLTTTASKIDSFVFKIVGSGSYLGYIVGQSL